MNRDETVEQVLDALRVRFGDGTRASEVDSLHLILEEEGAAALVTAVLDAAEAVDLPESSMITEYRLSILPEDHIDADLFCLYVMWRGRDRWAVKMRSFCLSRIGRWDHEPISSSRDDDWLADHRFDHDTAMRLAAEALPTVKVNGKTAADILAKEADRG